MKIALFGGSFDPVHREHVNFAAAAVQALSLDAIYILPARLAPHKRGGAVADGELRAKLCEIAFSTVPEARVSRFELQAEGTSYTYLTCRAFAEKFEGAELYFLVGADMLENFYSWREPEDILSHARLGVCGRGEALPLDAHGKFRARFCTDFAEVPFTGENISSTALRVSLAFGKRGEGLTDGVWEYLRSHRGAPYFRPVIQDALALEKEERREHSYRVAQLACARARSLGIAEEKALLAAALHDCAKYVPLNSPLLKGFVLPENVPSPVVHQYTGAYLAEHMFGISDEEILGAIRYHASGKEDMTALQKLIFLSDLLEPSRDFAGVDALRKLFWEDLDACLSESMRQQLGYLEESGKEVYPLTKRAYLWLLRHED